jgi:hypothetical protein
MKMRVVETGTKPVSLSKLSNLGSPMKKFVAIKKAARKKSLSPFKGMKKLGLLPVEPHFGPNQTIALRLGKTAKEHPYEAQVHTANQKTYIFASSFRGKMESVRISLSHEAATTLAVQLLLASSPALFQHIESSIQERLLQKLDMEESTKGLSQ